MTVSTIELATLHDMQFLLASAKDEGWNPGLSDATPFYYTDPKGFFIEKLNGQPIGSISAVAYNNAYGFMGFYIVLPKFRDKGYGIKLWNRGIARLGNRAIGLDGVVSQQENYKKSGFTFHYNNLRFGGKIEGRHSKELQLIDTIPFQTLVEFDTSVYGLDRNTFLQHWITMPNTYGFAKTEGGDLLGYGIIRKCENGYKVGPLFADRFQTANEIFLALAAKSEGEEIFLDVVQTNSDALKLAKAYQLNQVFETARMYKGAPPRQLLSNVFGVTTFELG